MRIKSKKLSHVERLFESLPPKSRTIQVLEFGMKSAGISPAAIKETLRYAKMLTHRKSAREEREEESF